MAKPPARPASCFVSPPLRAPQKPTEPHMLPCSPRCFGAAACESADLQSILPKPDTGAFAARPAFSLAPCPATTPLARCGRLWRSLLTRRRTARAGGLQRCGTCLRPRTRPEKASARPRPSSSTIQTVRAAHPSPRTPHNASLRSHPPCSASARPPMLTLRLPMPWQIQVSASRPSPASGARCGRLSPPRPRRSCAAASGRRRRPAAASALLHRLLQPPRRFGRCERLTARQFPAKPTVGRPRGRREQCVP